MLALAALLGLGMLALLASRRREDSAASFAENGRPLDSQASASLAQTVQQLMAIEPRNRGEAESTAMLLEDLASRVSSTNPQTAAALRRRAAELRTVMVSFPTTPAASAVPGGERTVQDVASILTGPSGAPSPALPAPGPAPGPAPNEPERLLAARVAENLQSRGRRYDRNLMRQFQSAVGLPSTAIYGTATREALVYYGQPSAPAEYTRTRTHFTPPRGYSQESPGPVASRTSTAQAADR